VTVYDVMVPRADIVAVEIGVAFSDLVNLMSIEGHSRMPVYRETLDDVCGMVHIKDVLACRGKSGNGLSLEKIVRKILFAAPSMRALDLLLEMRLTYVHMAMVVDEYGGVDGIVTIEDLVEEIVGEIEDEHDSQKTPALIRLAAGRYDADARITISEFEEQTGPILSAEEREEDINTLGGLVFSLAGRVPGRGEVIRHGSGHEFEILDADPRRIKFLRILVSRTPEQSDKTNSETSPASTDDSGDSASAK
jgi:CBS domain containing-hemolysin-like protein